MTILHEGSTARVVVCGDVDLASREELVAVVEGLRHHRDVVVDLDQVTFIDSSGLGALVGLLQRSRREGWSFAVHCRSEAVLHTFRLAGLTETLLSPRGAGVTGRDNGGKASGGASEG